MFRFFTICFVTLLSPVLLSCEKEVDVTIPDSPKEEQTDNVPMPDIIQITISGKTLSVTIEDNKATKALVEALRDAPITFEADDYGGFEKVGSLGRSLPTNNSQITTQAGDLILYNGNQIVMFYGSNSWSYTRIGKMKYGSFEELKTFLKAGQGRITVTLSL